MLVLKNVKMNNPANPAASSKPRHPPAHEWDELREALDASETESRPPYNVLGVAAKIGVASFLAANALLVPFLFGAFRRNAIPFVTTSDAKTRAILTALESQIFKVDNGLCIPPKQGSQFNFIDLGSGDGRVVIAASRDRKLAFTNCVGVEINSVLLGASLVKEKVDYVVRWIRRAEDLDSMAKVRFLKRDFWNLNLAPYQVVMVFGDLRLMPLFRDKFQAELAPGSFVVSNRFSIPGWTPLLTGEGWFLYRTRG